MLKQPKNLYKSLRSALERLFQNRKLRDNVSKNLPSWNLGGRQIVSGPIFSDSPYKNRLVANFSALEDKFWPKFSTFSMRGVKIGQNWRKNLFFPQVPNFIRFAWNSFLRSKTMSAMRFRLIFDIKMFSGTFRLKGVFGHFLTQSQISPMYRNAKRSHVSFLIRLICVYHKQK